MKLTKENSILLTFLLLLVVGCKKDDTGILIFKGVDEIPTLKSAITTVLKPDSSDHKDYYMHTANMKFSISEIWVSQDQIIEDKEDNLTWLKIGESTGLKFPSEYEFIANNLPEGEYRSIKIAFRDEVIRYAVYMNDISQALEMHSSLDESQCESDNIFTNYFCSSGNFSLDYYSRLTKSYHWDKLLFLRQAEKETIRGFKIKPGQTTRIFWKFGGANMKLTDCWFIWADMNDNKSWDCGIDTTRYFECNDNYPMWTFSVDDGEIIHEDTTEVIEEPKFVIDTNYSVTDIVGNKYKAVKIGSQIWMAENLRTNKLKDNTQIINVPADSNWVRYFNELQQPAQCVYNNDVDFLRTYGRFYNWHTIASGKLCPEGWHVPSKEEWQVLLDYLGENAGLMLRIASGNHWSVAATNQSKFSALPSGYRTPEGPYHAVYDGAFWWSSTPMNNDFVYQLSLPNGVTWYSPFDNGGSIEKGSGLCVRCMKDN